MEQLRQAEVIWPHETLIVYLTATATNRQATLPETDYPEHLTLTSAWLELIEKMSKLGSKESRETFALIGVSLKNRSIVLPWQPKLAGSDYVSDSLYRRARRRMLRASNAEVVIGDIHSHPNHGLVHLSPLDLLSLIGEKAVPVMAVIQENDFLFAFRSRESELMDAKPYLGRPDPTGWLRFCQYWEHKHAEQHEHELLNPNQYPGNTFEWGICQKICRCHHLVLYKGTLGSSALHRVAFSFDSYV